MDRSKFARRVKTAKNSVSLKPDRTQYAVKRAANKSLSPLQRLQKFKKLVEKQGRQQNTRPKKNLRVTFALDMEVESVVVNGSHEPDTEEVEDQKILKPRKPVLSKEKDTATVVPNGSSENGSIEDHVDIVNGENGHDEETESNDVKPIKRSSRISEKREGTPKKQTVKESTPKPESPTKRELRRRETPQKETTPKPETMNVRKGRSAKSAAHQDADVQSTGNGESQEEDVTNVEDGVTEEVIVINDSLEESKSQIKSTGFFSVFRKSPSSSSTEHIKDTTVTSPSSPSIVCLDSPSYSDRPFTPGSAISGRKSINAFARFPGRNVRITSVDRTSSASKRKADEYVCDDSPMKRFAGETESGSEKSPGWRFFSPNFARMWSPSQQKEKSPLRASTPFGKHADQDSMAVNYDEETKLFLEETPSVSSEVSPTPAKSQWPCAVM